MYLLLPGKHAPVYLCYTLGTLKNLVCHVWRAPQYRTLSITETTNVYARRRTGMSEYVDNMRVFPISVGSLTESLTHWTSVLECSGSISMSDK